MNGVVQWLKLAMLRDVVRRAARTAVIVGSILTGINHGDEIVSGTLTRNGILQICLTIMVPYIVSTTSSVATLKGLTRPTEPAELTDTKSASRSRPIVAK
jgi:hypothetical protein